MFTTISSFPTSGVSPYKRIHAWLTRSVIVGAVAAMLCLPSAVQAQDIDISEAISKALQVAFEKQFSRVAKVSPALVKVDPAKKTAVFEIANEGTDTLEAELTMANIAPNLLATSKPAGSSTLLAEDETPGGQDSIATANSLQSWVKDLPAKVKIAPGEKKTITVKIDVPASAKAGEYAGWLVATTLPSKEDKVEATTESDGVEMKISLGGGMKGDDGKPMKLQTGAKLTYVVDAK